MSNLDSINITSSNDYDTLSDVTSADEEYDNECDEQLRLQQSMMSGVRAMAVSLRQSIDSMNQQIRFAKIRRIDRLQSERYSAQIECAMATDARVKELCRLHIQELSEQIRIAKEELNDESDANGTQNNANNPAGQNVRRGGER